MTEKERDDAGRRMALAHSAALYGGPVWMLYGILEISQPLGADTAFDATRGYDVVVDRGLFTLYSAPGSVALALGAAAVLGLLAGTTASSRSARTSRALARLALALAAVSLAGVAVALDPLFTGPRIAGTLVLGLALCAAAPCVRGRGLAVPVAVLGVTGIGLLAIWPLVYAVEILPRAAGAAIFVAFGAGWIAAGRRFGQRAAGRARALPRLTVA
jgi:hypothetical protein